MDPFGKPPKSSIFDETTRNELLEAEKIAHKRAQADADVLEARFGLPNSRGAEIKLDGLFGVAPDNGLTPEEVLTPALASGQQITELDPNPNNAALGIGQTPDVQTVTQDAPQNALGFGNSRPTKNTDAGLSNDFGVLGNAGQTNVDAVLTGFTNDGATTGATGASPHLLAQQAVDQPATIAPAATGVIAAPAAGAGVAIPTAAEIAAGAAKAARVASPIAIGATIALSPTVGASRSANDTPADSIQLAMARRRDGDSIDDVSGNANQALKSTVTDAIGQIKRRQSDLNRLKDHLVDGPFRTSYTGNEDFGAFIFEESDGSFRTSNPDVNAPDGNMSGAGGGVGATGNLPSNVAGIVIVQEPGTLLNTTKKFKYWTISADNAQLPIYVFSTEDGLVHKLWYLDGQGHEETFEMTP
jgi:hypothetical protein